MQEMDIALCCIDLVTKELKMQAPTDHCILSVIIRLILWNLINSPIGDFDRMKTRVFTQQTLQLQKWYTLHLFRWICGSVHGVQGKKIMTKNPKNFCWTFTIVRWKDQQKTLDEYFETWRGRYEQVDDACVAGIDLKWSFPQDLFHNLPNLKFTLTVANKCPSGEEYLLRSRWRTPSSSLTSISFQNASCIEQMWDIKTPGNIDMSSNPPV